MGIRRVLAGAVLGLAGSALLALPAAAAPADPYGPDPTPGNLGTSATTVQPGEAVTVSGGGFRPGSTVTITVTVANAGFGRSGADAAPAPMGSLLAAGTTRTVAAPVQRFAAQTASVNAAGRFIASVVLTQAGTNVISATGIDPAGRTRTLTTVVFVGTAGGVGGPGSGGGSGGGGSEGAGSGGAEGVGGLPATGADLAVPAVVGGALVLLGAGALLASRRRKQEKAAA
jgi:LPXTG-motif cell wall-anchored protein